MLTLTLPPAKPLRLLIKEILLVTNADLRESANVDLLAVQNAFEASWAKPCKVVSVLLPNALTLTKATRDTRFHQQPARRAAISLQPRLGSIVLLTAWRVFTILRWPSIVGRSYTFANLTAPGRASSACCAWRER